MKKRSVACLDCGEESKNKQSAAVHKRWCKSRIPVSVNPIDSTTLPDIRPYTRIDTRIPEKTEIIPMVLNPNENAGVESIGMNTGIPSSSSSLETRKEEEVFPVLESPLALADKKLNRIREAVAFIARHQEYLDSWQRRFFPTMQYRVEMSGKRLTEGEQEKLFEIEFIIRSLSAEADEQAKADKIFMDRASHPLAIAGFGDHPHNKLTCWICVEDAAGENQREAGRAAELIQIAVWGEERRAKAAKAEADKYGK